jgi:hypothetical protein
MLMDYTLLMDNPYGHFTMPLWQVDVSKVVGDGSSIES